MEELSDFFQYLGNKLFAKKYREDPRNSEGGALHASRKYCNAVAEIAIYELQHNNWR